MQLFSSHFSESESEAIGKTQKLVKDNDVRNELYATHPVKFLADNITKLETRNYRVRPRFATLVSVDVERSFSMYRNILAINRLNFTFPNVEIMCISSYNGFLFKVQH